MNWLKMMLMCSPSDMTFILSYFLLGCQSFLGGYCGEREGRKKGGGGGALSNLFRIQELFISYGVILFLRSGLGILGWGMGGRYIIKATSYFKAEHKVAMISRTPLALLLLNFDQ